MKEMTIRWHRKRWMTMFRTISTIRLILTWMDSSQYGMVHIDVWPILTRTDQFTSELTGLFWRDLTHIDQTKLWTLGGQWIVDSWLDHLRYLKVYSWYCSYLVHLVPISNLLWDHSIQWSLIAMTMAIEWHLYCNTCTCILIFSVLILNDMELFKEALIKMTRPKSSPCRTIS